MVGTSSTLSTGSLNGFKSLLLTVEDTSVTPVEVVSLGTDYSPFIRKDRVESGCPRRVWIDSVVYTNWTYRVVRYGSDIERVPTIFEG